ncbi:hypothetical protein ACQRBF_07025 [Peptoniphilaceae bacterium SGI.131]
MFVSKDYSDDKAVEIHKISKVSNLRDGDFAGNSFGVVMALFI